MTRNEFIGQASRSEQRFLAEAYFWSGNHWVSTLASFSRSPWTCDCGHKEKTAALMFDHVSTHEAMS